MGTDLEVIVVDDCSSDDTPGVCAQIPGIRYVRLSANRGLANARNVGIAESSSDFISFLDDHDLRLPGSLDKQLRAITADERIALCYGQALIGDARRQLPTGELCPLECLEGDIFWDLLEHNFIPMPAVLARKSSLLKEGCFNTDLGLIEDWDMWLRLSERYLVAAAEPVSIYRKAVAGSAHDSEMLNVSAKLASNSKHETIFGFAARIETGKGPFVLAEALAQFAQAARTWSCVWPALARQCRKSKRVCASCG